MDWLPLLAAALTGALTGGLASVVSPWATRRQKEVELRTENRRARIKACRALVAEARRDRRPMNRLVEDERFLDLRAYLPPDVQQKYAGDPTHIEVQVSGAPAFADLAAALDSLENDWELI